MLNIVTATDYSAQSIHALRAAAKLAQTHRARLTVVHVVEGLQDGYGWLLMAEPVQLIEQQLRAEAMTKLRELCHQRLGDVSLLHPVNLRVEVGSPAEQILTVAHQVGADLVVVGTLGHGKVLSTFLGSTANQLIRWSDLPVMIVPAEQGELELRRILAPVESSAVSRASLGRAVALARAFGAKITLMHAVGLPVVVGSEPSFSHSLIPETVEDLVVQHRRWLRELVQRMEIEDVVEQVHVLTLDPAVAISQLAQDERIDLICMGSHGRRGVMRFLLGNTAERVLRRAPCAVMVMREASPEPLYDPADAPLEAPSLG